MLNLYYFIYILILKNLADKEKDDILEKVALKYQDVITDHYDNLARDVLMYQNIDLK